jgi:hypothetical protein
VCLTLGAEPEGEKNLPSEVQSFATTLKYRGVTSLQRGSFEVSPAKPTEAALPRREVASRSTNRPHSPGDGEDQGEWRLR